MTYSQKYALVQFLEPVKAGSIFSMSDWPPHVTIADVFAADINHKLIDDLKTALATEKSFEVEAGNESKLGDKKNSVHVVLINNTYELQALHNNLVDFLKLHGALFNSPKFTNNGFLPHCTYKNKPYLKQGDLIKITELSLIDLFVDEDWRMRKVLENFKLES